VFVDSRVLEFILPEIILIIFATWIFVGGAFYRNRPWWTGLSIAAYGLAMIVLAKQYIKLEDFFGAGQADTLGPFAIDALGHGVRWLAVAVGVVFTLMQSGPDRSKLSSERQGLVMLLVVGMMLVAGASELVTLFLGLELVSIPTYALLFLGRNDRANAEATGKYFFLSIFSSAILLYGFSFLYGIAGSTSLVDIHNVIAASGNDSAPTGFMTLAPIAAILIIAGLGFKIAAAPFHFYAPDVYQGASNANAGLLAVAPKVAGIVVLARLAAYAMPGDFTFGWQIILVLAMVTMTFGNVCALWQTNLRRLMAYSSIAHAGYMLIGLAVAIAGDAGSSGGVAAMILYLTTYSFASLATFAALAYLGEPGKDIDELDQIAGLGRAHSVPAAVIAISMFSLAGIPPLAGFWGKFALFDSTLGIVSESSGATSNWFLALAIVGAINAAIGAAYYLRVIGTMFFRPQTVAAPGRGGRGVYAAMAISAVLVAFIGLAPGGLSKFTQLAEKTASKVFHERDTTEPIRVSQTK